MEGKNFVEPSSFWLNTDDAAAYIRRSKIAIYNLIAQKKIPYIKVGRKVLFDRRKLDYWILNNQTQEVQNG